MNLYESDSGLGARQRAVEILQGTLNEWCDGLRPPAPTVLAIEKGDGPDPSQSVICPSSSSLSSEPEIPTAQPTADGTTNHNSAHRSKEQQQQPQPQQARVSLVNFGSYRLGVHAPSADIDVVALCPPHCTRHDFFTSLVRLLKKDDRIEDLHPIAEAYTPVIKFSLLGIPVDLVFVRLAGEAKLLKHQRSIANQTKIKSAGGNPFYQAYIIDDSDLVGLDEAGVRSLNGARVAQVLLDSVPDLSNFRTTLRAVKQWATVHGLYSNVLGFLGGVNYAILVACICRRHANASPPTLLKAFFQTFTNWNWRVPVSIGGAGPSTKAPPGVVPMPVWDGKNNPRDAAHLMPILTPAYPSMNSAYNVGIPQQRRLVRELHKAAGIVAGIEKDRNTWKDLFVGDNFFHEHSHFLRVCVIAENGKSFLPWFRLVEARLRLLIAGLEAPHKGIQAEPFAKFFDLKYDAKGSCLGFGKSAPNRRHEACFFVAIRFAGSLQDTDLRSCVHEFIDKINSWGGRRPDEMFVTTEAVMQSDLPDFVLDSTVCYHSDMSGTSDSDDGPYDDNSSDGSRSARIDIADSSGDDDDDDSNDDNARGTHQRRLHLSAKVVPVLVEQPENIVSTKTMKEGVKPTDTIEQNPTDTTITSTATNQSTSNNDNTNSNSPDDAADAPVGDPANNTTVVNPVPAVVDTRSSSVPNRAPVSTAWANIVKGTKVDSPSQHGFQSPTKRARM